ncbi:uncharacterized protein LOC142320281 isoform X2 [Lycorma delicatula]|uniref:uncharacterized protein LOC142320281 isoform X2 n=1 Tax=Lycorma delicatula TaxID=130591 RepID=UPI003F50EDF2
MKFEVSFFCGLIILLVLNVGMSYSTPVFSDSSITESKSLQELQDQLQENESGGKGIVAVLQNLPKMFGNIGYKYGYKLGTRADELIALLWEKLQKAMNYLTAEERNQLK